MRSWQELTKKHTKKGMAKKFGVHEKYFNRVSNDPVKLKNFLIRHEDTLIDFAKVKLKNIDFE